MIIKPKEIKFSHVQISCKGEIKNISDQDYLVRHLWISIRKMEYNRLRTLDEIKRGLSISILIKKRSRFLFRNMKTTSFEIELKLIKNLILEVFPRKINHFDFILRTGFKETDPQATLSLLVFSQKFIFQKENLAAEGFSLKSEFKLQSSLIKLKFETSFSLLI